MIKFKQKICILLCVAIAFIFSACTFPFASDTPTPEVLSPITTNTGTAQTAVTLYFKFLEQELLAGQAYPLTAAAGERVEAMVVRELISGPSPKSVDLKACINPRTEVLAVSSSADTVFITLSDDFTSWYNTSYPSQGDARDQAMMDQRLAVASIVNTITEMGEFSRVQLLVKSGQDPGQRITRAQAGFTDNPEQLLEPLSRDTGVLLSPNKSVEMVFKSLVKKDWLQLHTLIASEDLLGSEKPSLETFQSEMADMSGNLENYDIKGHNISADGQVVIVTADYDIRMKSGQVINKRDVPIRLVLDNGIWKVLYSSLKFIIVES